LAAKRQVRERQVIALPQPPTVCPDHWDDLLPLLDQALSRLPEKYRLPLILCKLEGRTYKEAARQLGLTESTVSVRLVRAKTMLAKRLARHGPAPSEGALALWSPVATAPPADLIRSTVKAAGLLARAQALTSAVTSAQVITLTQGVLKAMFLTKLASAAGVLLVSALLFGSGLLMLLPTGPAAASPGENRPVRSGDDPDKGRSAITKTNAEELVRAYEFNDALVDEKFSDKKVEVVGAVSRVRRLGSLADGSYQLEVFSQEPSTTAIRFEFGVKERKQLAALQPGQSVTIQGECKGKRERKTETKGDEVGPHQYIYFTGCMIVEPKK